MSIFDGATEMSIIEEATGLWVNQAIVDRDRFPPSAS